MGNKSSDRSDVIDLVSVDRPQFSLFFPGPRNRIPLKNGVWVEMKELNLVRLKDPHEESGEGRNKAGVEGVKEDGAPEAARAETNVALGGMVPPDAAPLVADLDPSASGGGDEVMVEAFDRKSVV